MIMNLISSTVNDNESNNIFDLIDNNISRPEFDVLRLHEFDLLVHKQLELNCTNK